ncbi:MAG: DoxX family protein [Bacteroidia bacterium]
MKKTDYLWWILRLIIALIYLQTLYFKFSGHPESVYIFSKMGLEPYGRIGLGMAELITACLLLIPQTKLYGLLFSLGIISGAVFSHLAILGIEVRGDGGTLFYLSLTVWIISAFLLFVYRVELRQLWKYITLRFFNRSIKTESTI